MIYVSTGGLKNTFPIDAVQKMKQMGVSEIELSGGIYHNQTLDRLKSELPNVRYSVHNYFPPPEKSFVVNLASINPEILEQSILHCEAAIEWAQALGSPTYGVHAGFLIDPAPSELGQKIQKRQLQDRDQSIEVFANSVTRIQNKAKAFGVKLLIENNVISPRNFSEFGDNPLLMADQDEINRVMKKLPAEVGLLLDVAHLKVSATTLKLDLKKEYAAVDEWISGYHLSDNDGFHDSNEPFHQDAWFLPLLRKEITHTTIEVYTYEKAVIEQQIAWVKKYVN